AMLGETALGLCDTKLVGALGAEALGGVGIATIFVWTGQAVVVGLMRGGVKVRTAYAVGEGRHGDAARYAGAGALVGALIGVALFLAAHGVTPLLTLIRLDPAMIPYAREFVAARSWGCVASCAGMAYSQYLQGIGDSRSPMVIGILGNVANAVLAW